MSIWRLHLKTDKISKYTREDLLEFCLNKQIIGAGWTKIVTSDPSEINAQAEQYENATAAKKAISAMSKMKIDDLVWTRLNGVYYLCRVTKEWKDRIIEKIYNDFDVANYVGAEWIEVGRADFVPGKVVNSMCPRAAVQSVNGVEEITKYIWNKLTKTNKYIIDSFQESDLWSMLSAENIEELFILYLQAKRQMYVYSTTIKVSTDMFECTMVDSNGVYHYPQVKSGSDTLNGSDYIEFLKKNPMAKIHLFAVSEEYSKNSDEERIEYHTKKELLDFIKENTDLLPPISRYWMEILMQKRA